MPKVVIRGSCVRIQLHCDEIVSARLFQMAALGFNLSQGEIPRCRRVFTRTFDCFLEPLVSLLQFFVTMISSGQFRLQSRFKR